MPGAEDELDAELQDLEQPGSAPEGGDEPTPLDGVDPNIASVLSPQAKGESGRTVPPAGAKAPVNWEQRYKSSQAKYQEMGSKMKALESVINNPGLKELAKKDPAVREALAKAGYEHALEAERLSQQEEKITPEKVYDELLETRAAWEIEKGMNRLERSIKRELTVEEKREVYGKIADIPDLSVEDAWRLSGAYSKHAKEAEDKRVQEAVKRIPGSARPRPMTPLMPGQKLNLSRPVTEMNEAERREFIAKELSKHDR